MVEYRGGLTEADYTEVIRLCRNIVPGAGGARDAPALFGLGFTVLAFWGYFGGAAPSAESLWWFAFAAPCFIWWWARRPRPGKQWRTTPALREEYHGRVTVEALETHLGAEARVPWGLFSGHAASPNVMVLFMGTRYVPLAKSFFRTDDDWQAATAIVHDKVAISSARGSSRIRTVALWILFLLVIFLTWHFAQLPQSKRRPNNELQRTKPAQAMSLRR